MFLKVSHNDKVSTFEKVFWFVGFLFFFYFFENSKPNKKEDRSAAY